MTLGTILFAERPLVPKKLVSLVFNRVSSAVKTAGAKLGLGVRISVAGSLV